MENFIQTVKDDVAKYLSVVNYPAMKEGIIKDVTKVGAASIIITVLQNLPHLEYHTPREVFSQLP